MKKKIINIRVSFLEKTLIKKKAEKSGLAVSEFCRRSALRQKISSKLTSEELDIYQELHKYKRNFELISNIFKVKDPELAKTVKATAAEIEKHLKKFQ